MKILKEISFSESPYIAQAVIENGVTLLVHKDFSADGSDGKTYYNIFEDDGDMLIPIGWSTEPMDKIE